MRKILNSGGNFFWTKGFFNDLPQETGAYYFTDLQPETANSVIMDGIYGQNPTRTDPKIHLQAYFYLNVDGREIHKGKNNVYYLHKDSPYLDPVIELAKRGQFVLTRKQILNFITAQPANRADAIQTLLNIQEIETIRKKLVKIRNKFDKEHKAEKKHLDSSKGAIIATIQAESFIEETVLEFINRNRAILNWESISNLLCSKLKEEVIMPTFIPAKEDNTINLIEKDIP